MTIMKEGEIQKRQQDIQRCLIQAHAMTRIEQSSCRWKMHDDISECICNSDSSRLVSLFSNELVDMDPSHSSSDSESMVRGNPPHHNLAWYIRAQNNICKHCKVKGHFSKYCNNPHCQCQKMHITRCLVDIHC